MGWKHWLGLESVDRTIINHEARIVTPDPARNPLRLFKASLPEGALDAPVADWPEGQISGYIAATCETARAAFPYADDWAIRSGAALANLLFDAHLPQLAVAYNLEGTREGVAREVGTFRLTGHDRAAFMAAQAVKGVQAALHDQDPDRNAADTVRAQAADPDAPRPGPHLATLWADAPGVLALFHEVQQAWSARPGTDPDAAAQQALLATSYTLNVLEYLSAQYLSVYDQTMHGLSKASDHDPERKAQRLELAFSLAVERVEIALPAPTVAAHRERGQRPM